MVRSDLARLGIGVVAGGVLLAGLAAGASPAAAAVSSENFDGVTAPALPSGWSTAASGAESPWVTSTTTPDTAPNDAFAPDPAAVGNTVLMSPSMPIAATGGSFSFRNNYNTEAGFDGMVLEISINGGAYADILTAGGSFTTGGYSGTISNSFSNPIGGRQAWTGNSGGYITTTVSLPPAASSQNIQLQWRMATDSSVASAGVRVDTILPVQDVTFGAAPTVVVDGTGAVSATTDGDGAITYSSTTLAACTVNSSTGVVTGVVAGTNNCTIKADAAATANYQAGSNTQTFSIGQGAQTINFTQPADAAVNAAPVTMVATGGASGNPVTFTSATSGVCTTSGTNGETVALVAVGTCTISANQTGDANYTAAPQVQRSFQVTAVAKLPQSQRAVNTTLHKGSNVVNPAGATTRQGLPQSARVSGSSFRSQATRGDLTCFVAKKGPNRKLNLKVTGQCRKLKIKVTYTAPGNNKYLPYKKTITFKYR